MVLHRSANPLTRLVAVVHCLANQGSCLPCSAHAVVITEDHCTVIQSMFFTAGGCHHRG